jgi:hypothetical protein
LPVVLTLVLRNESHAPLPRSAHRRTRDIADYDDTKIHCGVLRVHDGRVSVFTSLNGLSSDDVTRLLLPRER